MFGWGANYLSNHTALTTTAPLLGKCDLWTDTLDRADCTSSLFNSIREAETRASMAAIIGGLLILGSGVAGFVALWNELDEPDVKPKK